MWLCHCLKAANHCHSNIWCLESQKVGGIRRTGLGDKRQCLVQIPSKLYKSVDVVQFRHLKITFSKLCFQSLSDEKKHKLCSLDILMCNVRLSLLNTDWPKLGDPNFKVLLIFSIATVTAKYHVLRPALSRSREAIYSDAGPWLVKVVHWGPILSAGTKSQNSFFW